MPTSEPDALSALEGIVSAYEKEAAKFRRCGATTRRGTACQRVPEPQKRRCRLHGGRSTGPTTEEGRQRCREAARKRWEQWEAAGRPPVVHPLSSQGRAKIAAANRKRALRNRAVSALRAAFDSGDEAAIGMVLALIEDGQQHGIL